MAKKLFSRRYLFAATLKAVSPLKTSSGSSDNSDSDILVNCSGKPYIPGSSLAGVCRHYFAARCAAVVEDLFGYTRENIDEGAASRLVFYDAQLKNEAIVSLRDGVRLSADKTAVAGGKFDYEIIEAGAEFIFRFELMTNETNEGRRVAELICNGFQSGDICLGGKSTRGFGRMQLVAARFLQLVLTEKANLEKYIALDWSSTFIDEHFSDFAIGVVTKSSYVSREIKVGIASFLLIADRATLARENRALDNDGKYVESGKIIDSAQLLNAAEQVIIPGTSWAGAFRHHFGRILRKTGMNKCKTNALEDEVFGYVITKGKKSAGEEQQAERAASASKAAVSKIRFSETAFTGTNLLNRTRNAIDRFTGGACDKKLFTVRPAFGSENCEGILRISLRKDISDLELVQSIIDLCIEEMQNGYLTIGGDAAIGGGLLTVLEGDDAVWQ